MTATAVSPALRALLEHVVDYAGLFPPASLAMRDATAAYAAYRRSPEAWMLGRFVVPVARLDELSAEAAAVVDGNEGAWSLSVLVSADPAGDAAVLERFAASQRARFVADSVELRAASVEAVDWALGQLDHALERFVEIPLDPDPAPLVEALKRHGACAKARTGGITADAFPTADVLARFIATCARLDVPFKATAGLHHPVRGEQRLTYEHDAASATMFGFLNVFVAAALAREGADDGTLIRVLEERDAGTFAVEGDMVRWRDHSLDVTRLATTRRHSARSFGSCSFREPVDDLRRIGVL